jgi:hypothetical protein
MITRSDLILIFYGLALVGAGCSAWALLYLVLHWWQGA